MPLMTLSEFREYQRKQGAEAPGKICPVCKKPYQSHGERYRIGEQYVCESCSRGWH